MTGVSEYKGKIYLTRDDSMRIETYLGPNFRRTQHITVLEKSRPSRLKMLLSRAMKPSEKQNGLQDVTCDTRARLYTCEVNGPRIYCIGLNIKQIISSWQVDAGKPSALSVTKYGNLLVSCPSECKICEYTFTGDLVHKISFGCNMDGPRHALQFGSDLLVVCHGNADASEKSEGVSVIDIYGNISLGTKTMQLVNPCHLAVDSHQQVLIADKARNVIILANRTLDGRHRILLMSENKLKAPTRVYLNDEKGLLLVGLQTGALMIYCVKSPGSSHDDAAQTESASFPIHENTRLSDKCDDYDYLKVKHNTLYADCETEDDIYDEID